MLHALSILATSASSEDEPSKTAFYIFGGLLVAWALVVSFLGMSQSEFPRNAGAQRGVQLLTVVLVAGAMATAVITA